MEQNRALMIVPGRRQARRDGWARLIADWNRSGMSGVAFAAERGIDRRALYRWRQRVALAPARPRLIEVPGMESGAWAAEIATRTGTVRLSPSAPPSWAGQLIRELSQC
jgi:hypothetical protein